MLDNIIDLNPEPQNYLTVQSRQFALKAKMFMKVSCWNDDDLRSNDEQQTKKHSCRRQIFPCLVLRSRSRGSTKSQPPTSAAGMNQSDNFDLTHPHSVSLSGESLILTPHHVMAINAQLPSRIISSTWTLKFSTANDGFSLHSLYHKLKRVDSPVLLIIEDLEKRVFGAMCSCNPHVAEGFYGTSDCYLFTFEPCFQTYKWNGDNFYFIRGNELELCFGCGNGKYGLWLDCDLNKGRTERCSTYGNPPLIPSQDFIIKNLECWSF